MSGPGKRMPVPPELQERLDALVDAIPGAIGGIVLFDTGPALGVALALDGDLPPELVGAVGAAIVRIGEHLIGRAHEAAAERN